MTNDTEAPTLKQVEEQEERLAEIRDKIEDLSAEEEALGDRIADAMADGEEAGKLKAERREVREEREDLEAATDVLADRIEQRRWDALQAEARDRLDTIQKKLGGIAGEQPRRLERLEDAVETLEARVEALNGAYAKQQAYRREATALADRLEVEVPELRTVLAPVQGEATALMERVKGTALDRPDTVGRQHQPADRAAQAARELSEHGEDTPTPEVFEVAGELDADEWSKKQGDRHKVERQRREAERAERREAVDTFLRQQLADGPVSRDEMIAAARDELGDVLEGIGGGVVSALSSGRRRVDVRSLEHEDRRGTSYWGLDVDTGPDSPWRTP